MNLQEIIRWLDKTKDLDALDRLAAVVRNRQEKLRIEVRDVAGTLAIKWMKSLPSGTLIRFKSSGMPDAEICKHGKKYITLLFDRPVSFDATRTDTMWSVSYAHYAGQIQTVDPGLSFDYFQAGRAQVKALQKPEMAKIAKMGERRMMI